MGLWAPFRVIFKKRRFFEVSGIGVPNPPARRRPRLLLDDDQASVIKVIFVVLVVEVIDDLAQRWVCLTSLAHLLFTWP